MESLGGSCVPHDGGGSLLCDPVESGTHRNFFGFFFFFFFFCFLLLVLVLL